MKHLIKELKGSWMAQAAIGWFLVVCAFNPEVIGIALLVLYIIFLICNVWRHKKPLKPKTKAESLGDKGK